MPSSKTYNARVIVLRKRALGESDLIVSMLDESGAKIEAVAKGARKPQGALSSRTELFSSIDVLFAKGKNLDIVKEARLIEGFPELRNDPEKSASAAAIAELLDKVTQPELEVARLFALTSTAFSALSVSAKPIAPSIVGGHFLKTLAFLGLKPEFSTCVRCGNDAGDDARGLQPVSFLDGGIVCSECASSCDTVLMDKHLLDWCNLLLYSTFDAIAESGMPVRVSLDCLQFIHQLIKVHVGSSLKSLNFLMSYCEFCDGI